VKKAIIIAAVLAGIAVLLSFTDFTLFEAARFTLLSFIYVFLPGYGASLFLLKKTDIVQRMAVSIMLSLVLLPLPNLIASIFNQYIFTSVQTIAIFAFVAAGHYYSKK
jgi:hypothetical protein